MEHTPSKAQEKFADKVVAAYGGSAMDSIGDSTSIFVFALIDDIELAKWIVDEEGDAELVFGSDRLTSVHRP